MSHGTAFQPSVEPTPTPTPDARFSLPLEYSSAGIATIVAIVALLYFLLQRK